MTNDITVKQYITFISMEIILVDGIMSKYLFYYTLMGI